MSASREVCAIPHITDPRDAALPLLNRGINPFESWLPPNVGKLTNLKVRKAPIEPNRRRNDAKLQRHRRRKTAKCTNPRRNGSSRYDFGLRAAPDVAFVQSSFLRPGGAAATAGYALAGKDIASCKLCAGRAFLDPSDPTAKALSYVDDSVKPDQTRRTRSQCSRDWRRRQIWETK